jgi:eukaryotic-like serine/threonine-protein kinase
MGPGQWERVKEIYHSVLELDSREQAAYLERVCRGEPEILREVESLLAETSGGSFLERPAWEAASVGNAPAARRHPFLWVVWLVTAAFTAAFGYAAWFMTRDVAAFGWSEAQDGRLWLVASVDPSGPATGKLRPGDLLLSLNGDPGVARAGTLIYRRTLGIGAAYRVQVGRESETLDYLLETVRGRPDLLAALQGYLLGLGWCVIGVFIGFARPQDPVARLAFAAAVLTGFVFLQVNSLPFTFWALQPLHGVLGYHFFYRFPSDPPRHRGWRILLGLLYLGTVVTTAPFLLVKYLLFTQGAQSANLVIASPLGQFLRNAMVVVFGVAMLAAAAAALHKYWALTDPGQRRRFHWIALGGVIGLAPEVPLTLLTVLRIDPRIADWLLPGTAWMWCNWAVSWCSIAVPLGVAYAVVRHQVFDVRVAVRRGIQYLFARRALQAMLTLPSAAFLYTLVTQRNRTIADIVTGSSGFVYLILILGLSLKFRAPLLGWLDRKFFREHYDSEHLVLSLVDELGQFDSAEDVSTFVSRQVERSLHPKSIQLWWREGGAMRLASNSITSLGGPRFPISENLLESLKRQGTVAHVPLPAGSGVSGRELQWLSDRGVRLIVPLAGDERVDGVLLLGEKQSEEPYSASDIRLVHAVAKETAVVLDNLRLKGQVRDEQRIRHEVLAKLDQGLVSPMRECPVCGTCYDSGAEECDRDGTALTFTLPVARTIDGKYRLDRLIGRGGMGAVYAAHDLRLSREVAVKIMLGGTFGHDSAQRRFHREAQAVACLNHPNIVELHDFGELEGGGAYLVMERVLGVTLRAEIRRVCVFAPAETADWFEQMLDGLAAAHERGVVHRDFKPENIVGARRASGSLAVKILDFGLAKILPLSAETTLSKSITESGVVLGTLAYMAPEQLLGQEVDASADVYAAGVILVEMLTGCRPFADGVELRHDYHLPPVFPNYGVLDEVVQRCLAREARERFQSASELRGALIPALSASDSRNTPRPGRL